MPSPKGTPIFVPYGKKYFFMLIFDSGIGEGKKGKSPAQAGAGLCVSARDE